MPTLQVSDRAAVTVAALAVVLSLVISLASAPGSAMHTDAPAHAILEPTESASTTWSPTPHVTTEPTLTQPVPSAVMVAESEVVETTASVAAPVRDETPPVILSSSPAAVTAVTITLPVVEEPPPASGGCPSAISGTTPGAPSRTSSLGVTGTTSADLQAFAVAYNAIRVANCLPLVPFANIRYDSCMEDRLFWMAEDPSTDPMSAWGHIGSVRSDGVPSVGCDGNLAGGTNNDGSVVAQKWWDSTSHRASLYKPTYTASTAGACILFAMTHGGVPNEPLSFTRAAARWVTC